MPFSIMLGPAASLPRPLSPRRGISTAGEFLCLTDMEALELLDMNIEEVRHLRRHVGAR